MGSKLPEVIKVINRDLVVTAAADDVLIPNLINEAGAKARYAWEEFIYGEISNLHTRRAYGKAVGDLLKRADEAKLTLSQITPKFVRSHFEKMETSVPTRKLRLAAVRHFFDIAVTRHAMALNPALSVRSEKYKVSEGKTPEITVSQTQKLLKSIQGEGFLDSRDKTIIAIFTYTAVRVGAIQRLTLNDFHSTGGNYSLRFKEKGGKPREIPVRDDLEKLILQYLAVRGAGSKNDPFFPSAVKASGNISNSPMHTNDIRRMLKRRLLVAGLSTEFSPHSFRVCALTDLLNQDVPREDVQHFAGHADARTTDLYDRRKKKITRNIVERISVKLS